MTRGNPIERLECVIPYTADHPFPLENLPWTVFSTSADEKPRCAVRIADSLLDLALLSAQAPHAFASGPLSDQRVHELFSQPTLNAYLAEPRQVHRDFRSFLQHMLSSDSHVFNSDSQAVLQAALVPVEQAKLHLPIRSGDYTDFCASKYHCTATGRLMFNDPTRPLEDQWFQLPIAYHGRSSSLVVSGTNFHRPNGIFRTRPGSSDVQFGPSKRMDFELEVAFVVAGSELSPLGRPVKLEQAEDAIFGMMLMNDWSARDIQAYEMNPLGPFTGKNFATTLSPYLVELAALEPFRTPSPTAEHTPFAYLDHKGNGSTWDVRLQAFLSPSPPATSTEQEQERVWTKITDTSLKHVYWTASQMVAHHTITGCNLKPADTFATGTCSGPFDEPHSEASLIEACKAGRQPIPLDSAKGSTATETRCFLLDGDEVKILGHAFDPESKLHIGLGECTGQILPAIAL
ncbi:fumarylacetoacetase [Moesziomyces antarcticus T-34]|uniref:Fumarylacetoacetase n=1 Tax=Pseudozyma antarctica (strain T-34) TaxID=1151754 RepID=M9LN95_PSEA3|nr:fumarylacetoacetase [Moesziomyces antarcticus T-34]